MKKLGFLGQAFDYDVETFNKNQLEKKKISEQIQSYDKKLMTTTKSNFQELMNCLMHLKVMRVFVEGVLRFSVPAKFYMCIVKPHGRNHDKLIAKLTNTFAEEHLKDIYGEKEDAQDEDFFPYVISHLNSPQFLMQ